MTITAETTPLHHVKVRCETCKRNQLLFFDDASIITQAVLDQVNFAAERHEHFHPKHSISVQIYEKAPEVEVPII